MAESMMLGGKVRGLRRREKLTQAQLAQRLGVSASYLNLIENNRRPLTAALLLKLAKEFNLDLNSFAPADAARLVSDLSEVLGDPMFDATSIGAGELREVASASPALAHAVLKHGNVDHPVTATGAHHIAKGSDRLG